MKYELTKDYLTGIDEIDKEHAKLFELANECYDLVMEAYDKAVKNGYMFGCFGDSLLILND